MTLKMGKLPPVYDPRTLRLENYINVQKLPPLPETSDWFAKTGPFPMDGNDQLGDCVVAGAAHMIQTWSANAGNEVVIPSKTVVNTYLKLTGGADTGLNMLEFLKFWQKTGIAGHKIGPYLAFDPKNIISWRYANYLAGGVFAGFMLPQSAVDQFDAGKPWTVVHGSPIAGGHCANAGLATPRIIQVGTWAKKQTATVEFVGENCDEAWAILSLEWFDKSHKAPTGLAWKELLAALKAATK